MLIYDILKSEHDRIKFLLAEITELTEDDVKWHSPLFNQLQEALIPHSKAEETAFYNVIHAHDKAKNIALYGYQEHLTAEYLLRNLRLKDRIDQDWKTTALQLQAAVEQHISDEENAIFPLARQLFSDQEAYVMGQEFTRLREDFRREQNGPSVPNDFFGKNQSAPSINAISSGLNEQR